VPIAPAPITICTSTLAPRCISNSRCVINSVSAPRRTYGEFVSSANRSWVRDY
jgi:hypothetical protein